MSTPPSQPPRWPGFRGIDASGVSDSGKLPTTWDVETGTGVRWRTPIPGLGHSSPVVWGDRVFVTSAVGKKEDAGLRTGLYGDIESSADTGEQEWRVHCVDRRTGRLLWSRVAVRGVPKVRRHTKGTHANPTVATDGRRLVASFGSEGLFCFDMDGKPLWRRDLGVLDAGYYEVPDAQWGFASSPVIAGNRVVVQCDIQKDGFLAALDLATGRDVWRAARADVPTWSTPQVVSGQVVVNGWRHIGGYDLATGREVWRLQGGGDIPVPTPVVAGDLVYVTNAHGMASPIYAVRFRTASGDITPRGGAMASEGVAWSTLRGGAYMQTPVAYRGHLYVCRDNGVLGCRALETGKEAYEVRLGTGRTGFTASAVAGDGKVYFTAENGEVHVVAAGPRFVPVGGGTLGEPCLATPAIAGSDLLFRTQGHLVSIRRTGA